MKRDLVSDVYEWQPFIAISRPCCESFAVQKHAWDHCEGYEEVRQTVENNFCIDSCLENLLSIPEARPLVDKIQKLLATGGFQTSQWASNRQSVVAPLLPNAQLQSLELWLSQNHADPVESTLGLK